MIDVLEDKERAAAWAKQLNWTIPVLLDLDGKLSASYAPEGVLPDIPRQQVPIASNLIIDKEGKIQILFSPGFYKL